MRTTTYAISNKDILEAVASDDEAVKFRYFVEKLGVPVGKTYYEAGEGTAAHIAAKYGNLHIVKYVLEKDPSILKAKDKGDTTVFFMAIENGHLDIVKYLVENHNVSILERDDRLNGNTPIHAAVEHGQLAILKYFIEERNGEVNITNKFKQPPVFFAVLKNNYPIMIYLVEEQNADLTMIDHKNNNILFMAVQVDDLSIMKYVLDKRKVNLDIDHKNLLGDTLVSRAAFLNRYEILKYLVTTKKAKIDEVDEWGKTALHGAARKNHYKICKYLVEHGADPRIKGEDGKLPMDEATRERVRVYLENVTKNRQRRSVPMLSKQSTPVVYKWKRGITQNSSWSTNSLEGRSTSTILHDTNAFHLQSFLIVANILRAGKSEFDAREEFISPREILRKRMDPIAVDAVTKLSIS